MTNKPIIPVFSGERMHGETIEGFLFIYKGDTYLDLLGGTAHIVKPKTIRISLDNGTTFRTLEEVNKALLFKELYNSKAFLHGEWTPEKICCRKCNPEAQIMILCPKCGNKRCPKAFNHDYKCTESNEVNQKGVYEQ